MMKPLNVIALVLAFLVICLGILLGGPLLQFLDIPSFLFVLAGPISISLASFKPAEVGQAFKAPFSKKRDDSITSAVILNALAGYSLAFGVIGSLIGLINMLAYMEDPKTIGLIMAVCLITTFYGLILSQFVYQPLASHIEQGRSLSGQSNCL